jgi:hypothetical protein
MTQHPRRFPAASLPLLVERCASCRPSASRTADLDTASGEAFTPTKWAEGKARQAPDISAVRTQQLSSPHIMTRLESDRHHFAPKSQKPIYAQFVETGPGEFMMPGLVCPPAKLGHGVAPPSLEALVASKPKATLHRWWEKNIGRLSLSYTATNDTTTAISCRCRFVCHS